MNTATSIERRRPRRGADAMADAAALAGFLWVEHHWSQARIAAELGGLSQAQVSRLLKKAEDLGYLRRVVTFDRDKVGEARLNRLLGRASDDELVTALGAFKSDAGAIGVTRAYVLQTTDLPSFAAEAAAKLARAVSTSARIGTAWGGLTRELISALRKLSPPGRGPAGEPVLVVPLAGDLRHSSTDVEYSASLHAKRLAEWLAPAGATALNLVPTRAFVPVQSSGDRRAELVTQAQRALFEPTARHPLGLAAELSLVLTSVSPYRRPLGFKELELLEIGKCSTRELARACIGDIGGLLLADPQATGADLDLVRRLHRMWTGITLAQLREVARRADPEAGEFGVVVLARGAQDRAKVLIECIRASLVNVVVVDHVMRAELMALASAGATTPAPAGRRPRKAP